jgi:hypothetical protein
MKRLLAVCLLFIFTSGYWFYKIGLAGEEKNVLGVRQIQKNQAINVSFSLGENRFTLFGYSSPQAQVTLDGMGVFDQTQADYRGYFEFVNRFSPFSPREACLTAKDQFGRLSAPVCLPAFPTDKNVTIGPVVMPPTLSLDKSDYYVGDEVILSGQTIPNSDVNLSMFTKDGGKTTGVETAGLPTARRYSRALTGGKSRQAPLFSLIKPAQAFTLPELSSKSDTKGNFSIALPSASNKNYRFFTRTNFLQELSPRSLTLNLKILPLWMMIIKFFLLVFNLLKPFWLEFLLVIEVAVLIHLFLHYFFHPYQIITDKAITVRENLSLEITDHSLLIPEKN